MSDEDLIKLDSVMAETAKDGKTLNNGLTFDFDKKVLDSLIAVNAPKEAKFKGNGDEGRRLPGLIVVFMSNYSNCMKKREVASYKPFMTPFPLPCFC